MRPESFLTVRSVGGLLPTDVLTAVTTGKDLPGLTPADYGLAEVETVREAANRSWDRLLAAWAAFRRHVPPGPVQGAQTETTRNRWLRVLFEELGYGRLPAVPPGGLTVGDTAYPLSHLWQRTPIHLLGAGVPLDVRTPGVPGAATRAPHSMVQELLNRSPEHLWGFVTNGLQLRLLRDSASLVRQAYVEFDLASLFDGEVFADFVLAWLLCHASRVEPQPDPSAPPATCWLERWREEATTRGTRALASLRTGVAEALTVLGRGFLRAPANTALREELRAGMLPSRDYYRLLLRVVYRLLVLFVAEDRNLLHPPGAPKQARAWYAAYFSTARLRRLANRRRTADRHGDLWVTLRLVMDGLGAEEGLPELGLPALGGLYEPGTLGVLGDAEIANRDLLTAMRALAVTRDDTGLPRQVDYRNLGAEELGSVYESLLELVPTYDPATGAFDLSVQAGHDRKTTGSYYTPTGLVEVLLDYTLDPLLDQAVHSPDPEAALLALTVCDPACGSGHFLVAAGRRLARRLAAVRTGEAEPDVASMQTAMRDVVARCLYGVDLNPLAAELAKVALWLETLEPGAPLSFLDGHIKVGNSLLGTTPELVAAGLPDAAFTPLTGDNRMLVSKLKRRNAKERDTADQFELPFEASTDDVGARLRKLAKLPEVTLPDVHRKEAAWRQAESAPALMRARLAASAWCAAFVWPRHADAPPALTSADIRRVSAQGEAGLTADQRAELDLLCGRYRFFSWPLEFPDVFPGGFSCIMGNPPWEHLELNEKEFFGPRDPTVAEAPTAAERKKRIARLADCRPALWLEYQEALRDFDAIGSIARGGGRFPLTVRGRLNTYALFAETARSFVAWPGRLGIILPTGIATDANTAPFFRRLIETETLAALLDFENEAKIFPDVHHAYRFAVLVSTGGEMLDLAIFAFSTRHLYQLPERRFALRPQEILLLNPNTGTCPVFRSRRDAEITLGIYQQTPILVREGIERRNPWQVSFSQGLFNMASDSDLFRTEKQLRGVGGRLVGNVFTVGDNHFMPLCEAKMLHCFDHRYGTYEGQTKAQANQGTLPRLTSEQHDDPDHVVLPRYWVAESEVDKALTGRWDKGWLLGWRDIARSVDERTVIAAVLPRSAVGHTAPLALPATGEPGCLQANLSSFVLDYCARQKLSGAHLTFSVMAQLPVLPPGAYHAPVPWAPEQELRDWVAERVLELSYTSWDLQPYALDLHDDGPPFRWDQRRRAQIRAEIDAAYLHLYGLQRDEAEHVIDSFFVLRKNEEKLYGEFRTRRLVLAAYDEMAIGRYVSPLDPPPGHGPRHPDRSCS